MTTNNLFCPKCGEHLLCPDGHTWYVADSLPEDDPPHCQFYEVTVLVDARVDALEWDSSCDETFGVAALVPDGAVVAYRPITREDYEQRVNDIFDEGGGI